MMRPSGMTTVRPQHILAHGAVAHRVGAAGPGRGHAADRGIRPRVDGKHEAGVAEIFVELLPRHPRLHPAVQVLGIHFNHLVHFRDIDGDAAVQRRHMPFERRARAKGDDRHLVFGANLDNLRHFLGAPGIDHGIRRHHRVMVLALAMLLAHGLGGRQPVAIPLLQDTDGIVNARLRPMLDLSVNLKAHNVAPANKNSNLRGTLTTPRGQAPRRRQLC